MPEYSGAIEASNGVPGSGQLFGILFTASFCCEDSKAPWPAEDRVPFQDVIEMQRRVDDTRIRYDRQPV